MGNYVALKQHVDKCMNSNNYSMVDMTRLFSAFAGQHKTSRHLRRMAEESA